LGDLEGYNTNSAIVTNNDETPPIEQSAAETARLTSLNSVLAQAARPNGQPNPPSTTSPSPIKNAGNEYGVGTRLGNPLSIYSSYTYQLSLYMISPDAYDAFNQSGRKNIFAKNGTNETESGVGGAYLIAQSGGINDDATRAPGFEFDYYIDNLEIKAAVSGSNSANGTTVSYDLSFNIVEPYGFSFITNMKRAKIALSKYSQTINYSESENPTRQLFILGIKFLGYDSEGNLLKSLPEVSDPSFQRYYDIVFKDVGFSIDGKSTVYNIKAAVTSIQAAYSTKRGLIDKGAGQLSGSTVGQLLDELMEKLTKDQTIEGREFPNTYAIEYVDDADEIAKSSIVATGDYNKIKWPMAAPKDKTTVNANLEIKAQPNNKERVIAFNPGTPIIQAITSVITQSDYLVNGLKSVYSSEETPSETNDGDESIPINSNKRLKWFTVTPFVSNAKFDRKIKDWVYDITYQVRTYEIPVIKSVVADKTAPYYGPVKRYEYWYTGKNSEIIKYSQTLNNNYFVVALAGSSEEASSDASGGSANIPIGTGKRTYTDRLGKLNVGKEAQNSIQTDLADGGSWATAKIEILGDPDYLSNPTPPPSNDLNGFYNEDDTINYSAGQVFIEIKFVEAVDYDNNQGTMTLNHDILFWNYPKNIAEKLQGAVSYRLATITHTFKSGRFTQRLDLTFNTFGDVEGPKLVEEGRENNNGSNTSSLGELGINTAIPSTTSQSSTSVSSAPVVGLVKNTTVSRGTTGASVANTVASTTSTQSTSAKGVADDDAKLDVNSRIKIGLGLEEGRESSSLINRVRNKLGIPIGGTNPTVGRER
jgi:hypothetical protein